MKNNSVRQKESATVANNQKITASYTEFRSGILPAPDDLAKYEELLPGVTNRLLTTYESQVNHRIELEKIVIKGDSCRALLGQILSFIIVMSVLCISGFLFYLGKSIAGLSAVVLALASLIPSFIYSRNNRKKELEDKNNK